MAYLLIGLLLSWPEQPRSYY